MSLERLPHEVIVKILILLSTSDLYSLNECFASLEQLITYVCRRRLGTEVDKWGEESFIPDDEEVASFRRLMAMGMILVFNNYIFIFLLQLNVHMATTRYEL